MNNSHNGYYGATAAASAFDDVVPDRFGGAPTSSGSKMPQMSRGMALEAAVEKLPNWYFDDDDDHNDNDNNISSSTSSSAMTTRISSSSSSNGSNHAMRRSSQRYFLTDDDPLGSVAELTLTTEDDDDEHDNNHTTNKLNNHKSIRDCYLFDAASSSPEPAPEPVLCVKTPTSQPPPPPLYRSSSSSSPVTATATATATSPPLNTHRTRRLSSRRSTLSPSIACTDLVVTRYTMGGNRDKKVMYHIDVVPHESQLQTYTIRRSYTDFKALHAELSAALDARKEYYASRAQLRLSVLESASSSVSFSNGTGSNGRERRSLRSQFSLPEDAIEAAVMAFSLPTLPHAGFLSFWRRHDHAHLTHRCSVFQEMLRAILTLPCLRESFAMQTFLSTAPCAIRERGSSYVSLCEYSVPTVIDVDEEHRERRRRAQEHRRNSSVTSVSMGMYEY